MQLKPLALGAIACASVGEAAAAQQMPVVPRERQLTGAASLSAAYDSNFARSTRALADQRRIKPEELTLRPQLSLNVAQPIGQQIVFLRGSAGYDLYRENDRLNRARADLQGGAATTIGFCQATAVGAYQASQSDLATIDSPGVKNFVQVTSSSLGVQCGRPQGFTGSLMGQRGDTKNSASIQKEVDSTVESLAATFGYGNPTLGSVALVYSYANNEMPNRINPGRPVGDSFFTQTYGVTVQRNFGSRLAITGTAGRTMVKREFAPAGVDQKFTSTTYAGSVTYKVGSRATVELVGDRAVMPTSRAGKLYDISTSGEVRGRYRLGSRYQISLGHRIEDVESNADTSLPRQAITESRTNSTYASVRYQQSRRASLSVDVRYDDRNTNLPEFNYNSTRIGLTAEVGF